MVFKIKAHYVIVLLGSELHVRRDKCDFFVFRYLILGTTASYLWILSVTHYTTDSKVSMKMEAANFEGNKICAIHKTTKNYFKKASETLKNQMNYSHSILVCITLFIFISSQIFERCIIK